MNRPRKRDTSSYIDSLELFEMLRQWMGLRVPYMAGRGARILQMAEVLGQASKLSASERFCLRIAAAMHDVGMLRVPDAILLKPQGLSRDEEAIMRTHPAIGARAIAHVFPELPEAARAILFHHERPDGMGIYAMPEQKIPQLAGMIALCEGLEAMSHDRPYRKALCNEAICEQVEKGSNRQFTAQAVKAFEAAKRDVLSISRQTSEQPPARPAAPRSVAVEPASETSKVEPSPPPAMLLTAEQSRQRAEEALAGRSFSGTVARVIASAGSPNADLREISQLIARDPMLAGRVIQVANSAAYASRKGQITTLEDAVRNVGCTAIRNIAAALAIFDATSATGPGGHHAIRCWQHSLAVAVLTERFIGSTNPAASGTAYLAGLCHNLGELFFYSLYEAEYAKVLEQQSATRQPIEQVERSILGMTQHELSFIALRKIGLPDAIREPIESLHNSAAGGAVPSEAMARALYTADAIADGMLLCSSGAAILRRLTAAHIKQVMDKEDPLPEDLPAFRGKIVSTTAIMAGLSRRDEQEVVSPIFKPLKSRWWVVRPLILSKADPFCMAMSMLCDAKIAPSAPSDREARDLAGIVLLGKPASMSAMSRPVIYVSEDAGDALPGAAATMKWPVAIGDLYDLLKTLSAPKSAAA